MLEIGSTIGGIYTVMLDVGRGGTSHVYLVMNQRAGKQWAAKEVPKTSHDDKEEQQSRLIADADILKKLRHPHIPSIVDVIETEENYYILMDFIEGRTLLDVLKSEGAQDQKDVVKWAIQICDVFKYLHGQTPKIVYRDTKPSNIMLKPNGDVVLIDFGTAREFKPLQGEDTLNLGTPGYASPEQYAEAAMGQTDERSDIYNLGATMYHLLTNHNPSQPPYDMYPIRHWNPELSSGLERIILKCTRRNPEDRYQTADELLYDLEHYTDLDDKALQAKKRKNILMWICAMMSILCLAGGLFTNTRANTRQNTGYEDLIRLAETATTKKQQIDYYAQAISLNPTESRAYRQVLTRVFLTDDFFDQSEAETMMQIMLDTSNGRTTNESRLKSQPGYDAFAYELGLAYFYYYGGTGNKPMAESWLKMAAESDNITLAQRERAKRLSNIASYYVSLGQQNKAGDSNVSYADYWADIAQLSKGNIVQLDNAKTALVVYQETVYQIRVHANDFRKAGVAENELTDMLSEIESHIRTDINIDDREANNSLINKIFENIAQGREAVRIAFGGRE